MGRRAGVALVGLVLALVLVASYVLASNHVGCRDIMRRVICEPGRVLLVDPA